MNRFVLRSLLIVAFACGSACSNPNLSPKDTLTTTIGAPVQSLNPLFSTDANSQHLNELAHAGLVKTSENLVPEPYLAEYIRPVGNSIIEVQLKRGCLFENGKEITSEDVRRSLEIFRDPENKSPFAETFKVIKRFDKIDRYRFRLITEKAEPALLSDLAVLKILPDGAIKKGESQSVIPGAGPFRVTSLGPSQIVFERNPQSCFPLPRLNRIKVKVVRDDLSRFLKLKNGEIDLVMNEMNFRKVEMVMNDPALPLQAIVDDGIGYNYLGVNMNNDKLRDRRVREALALSFDIPSLIKYKSRGMALPARNLLADRNFYANLSVPVRSRDLTKAKQLLDEAGFYNGTNSKPPLKLTLTTTTNLISIENARVLTAQAKEAGIELEHKAFEWGIFYNDVKSGNAELYLLRWVGVTDPGIYFEVFHSGEIGRNNRTRYKNPEMDRWIEMGQSTLNSKIRKQAFDRVQEIAYQDLPFIGLWHVKNAAVFRKELKGVKLHPAGSWLSLTEVYKE